MAHPVGRAHSLDKRTLQRLNAIVVLGVIGSALAACVVGACIVDFGRLISLWP